MRLAKALQSLLAPVTIVTLVALALLAPPQRYDQYGCDMTRGDAARKECRAALPYNGAVDRWIFP